MMARYYSSSLGRFLAVDASTRSINDNNPQSWNRYAYTLNNPLVFVDPDGKLTQLAIGGKTECNPFGHISLIINDQVFSAGTTYSGRPDWGVSTQEFFGRADSSTGATQDDLRQTTIITLNVTPEQEAGLLNSLSRMSSPDVGLGFETQTCAGVTEQALTDSGILQPAMQSHANSSGDEMLQTRAPVSGTPSQLQSRVENQPGLAGSSTNHGYAPAVTTVDAALCAAKERFAKGAKSVTNGAKSGTKR
jgi:uncharacterized protein RhaS with RHS repeats